jgi:hypothetical protein
MTAELPKGGLPSAFDGSVKFDKTHIALTPL